jgi:HSP20 family protein
MASLFSPFFVEDFLLSDLYPSYYTPYERQMQQRRQQQRQLQQQHLQQQQQPQQQQKRKNDAGNIDKKQTKLQRTAAEQQVATTANSNGGSETQAVATKEGKQQRKQLSSFSDFFGLTPSWTPTVDLRETSNNGPLHMDIELPGVKRDDISIELNDGVLSISGQRNYERKVEKERWLCNERSFGSFTRWVKLPEGTTEDHITAKYEDGVLSITVDRPEVKKPEARRIAIGGKSAASSTPAASTATSVELKSQQAAPAAAQTTPATAASEHPSASASNSTPATATAAPATPAKESKQEQSAAEQPAHQPTAASH